MELSPMLGAVTLFQKEDRSAVDKKCIHAEERLEQDQTTLMETLNTNGDAKYVNKKLAMCWGNCAQRMLAAVIFMKEFQEFADRLKEVENQKRQRIKFCQQHNFGEEVRWLQKQLVIISEIRMEMEMVAHGNRKPSEATFVDL